MPIETLLGFLPQEYALMVVLFIVGLTLLVIVGVEGIPHKKLKKPFRIPFLLLSIAIMGMSVLGYLEVRADSKIVKETILETPQITEQPYYPAANFIKESFDKINSAGNKLDIAEVLPSLYASDISQDIAFWWSIKVKYEIFGCDENIIDVRLQYYNRSDTFFNKKTNESFSRYTLDKINDKWIVTQTVEITGSGCSQVFP